MISGNGFETTWSWSSRGVITKFRGITKKKNAKSVLGPGVKPSVHQIKAHECYLNINMVSKTLLSK
jgi:hypothetical protein